MPYFINLHNREISFPFPVGTVFKPTFTSFAMDSKWGAPSLNDLAVDGTLNTTNQPTNQLTNQSCRKKH